MSTTDTNFTTDTGDPPRAHRAASVSPDDQLPPVAPPSAGFIAQLFVIPALIVAIIFAIGWGIKWLADRGADPSAYVSAMKRGNDGSWQAAHNLADLLRNQRYEHLKDDPALAAELVDFLQTQIDSGSLDEHAIELRIYLCNALGEFRVPKVVDILVKTARLERDPQEANVRMAAVKALAVHLSLAPSAVRVDPHARLELFAEAGHLLLVEQSAELLAQLKHFMSTTLDATH